MKKEQEYKPINLKEVLPKMKVYAKEKDRLYREEKRIAEKAFGH